MLSKHVISNGKKQLQIFLSEMISFLIEQTCIMGARPNDLFQI